ncbi:MAG: DUF1592 domain-containing protein [Gemmatimonadetes bacterium]|nr:DUF1592 domain-containing protein [Gemmatimonadota bacterium]
MNTLVSAMLVAGLVLVGLAADAGRAPDARAHASGTWTSSHAPGLAPPSDSIANEVIQTFCVRCHGQRVQNGGLRLDGFDVAEAGQNAEIAEKMIRKLRAGMMPPPGPRRPDAATLATLAETLENRVDEDAALRQSPGRRTFQRLNRTEYARSIQDLLGIEVDVEAFLPPETVSNNFDNISDVQIPSATQMEGFLRAASHISRVAVGDPDADPTSTTYKVSKTISQMEHAEGAPYGTRGGISVVHIFPADGDYVFRLELHPGPTGFLYGRTVPEPDQLEVSINGERVALVEIDRWMTQSDPTGMVVETEPIHVRAGPQRLTAAFIRTFEGPVDDLLTPVDYTLADTQIGDAYGVTTGAHLRDLGIVGPYNVTGVSDTPSRRRIFSCRPTSRDEERPCAEEIVSRLGSRAYRRPLAEDDLADLMRFYEAGAEDGGFELGIRTALHAILASPHFIFRIEKVPAGVSPGDVYRISDIDLASRLAFFLWATPPDAELIALARDGELSSPMVLEQQTRRMLADPRSEALATRFASQWLRLQDLEKIRPDPLLYPYYDLALARAMDRETELFFHSLVLEDRGLLELITADYTFVNERLARHYGIPGITGNAFQRVTLVDENRRGLLGQGSILTLTSHADRTSAVLRGKWVMEVFLGSPPPPPPPDVPDLEATEGVVDGRLLSVRERMEQHRSRPQCQSCHRMMDPIGLALENFDVTGRWRIKDNGVPVDPVGELFDGTPITSPSDLRQALLRYPEAFISNFTANLMAYAVGRRVEYYDMPAVRTIAREAAVDGSRLSSLILGVVKSDAFQMSQAEGTVTEAGGSS